MPLLKASWDRSLRPSEIIVVNDGSTDGSERIMSEILHHHPDIVFWSQPNQGAYQAINAGIHRATGDLVAILNSDDCYHPQRLKRCAQVLAASTKITAVTTALDFMDASGKKVKNRWYERNRSFYDKEGDLPLALMNGNFFMTTSNIVIRRSVFQDIGYFAPLRYVHDLDFFLRLLVHGKHIHIDRRSAVVLSDACQEYDSGRTCQCSCGMGICMCTVYRDRQGTSGMAGKGMGLCGQIQPNYGKAFLNQAAEPVFYFFCEPVVGRQ